MTKHTIDVYWSKIIKYLEENAEDVPEKTGVYEILVKLKDKNEYKRKYIGRAANLHRRYLEHLSDEEENENIHDGVRDYICGFDYALIGNEPDRKDAEKGLYEKHDYPWNEVPPEGSGRDLDIEVIEHNPGEE